MELIGATPDLDELRVDGTVQLGLFETGGKAPTAATLSIKMDTLRLADGEAFRKGDRLSVTVECVVFDAGQRDHFDRRTGQVVSCTQYHEARVLDVQVEHALPPAER